MTVDTTSTDVFWCFNLFRYMKGSNIETEYDMTGALDEFRLWQYAKSEAELSPLRNLKFEHYIDGLVLNLPMDEGQGTVLAGLYYDPLPVTPTANISSNKTAGDQKYANFVSFPPLGALDWAPSGAPLQPHSNYTLTFRNATLKEKAIELCQDMFYSGSLQKYCSPRLVPQSLFYYESCLADIADSSNLTHHKLSVSLFGFYCQKVLGIKECLLYGTYDAFPRCQEVDPKVDLTPREIGIIVICSVLFIAFSCCTMWALIALIHKRRKKKHRVQRLNVEESTRSGKYTMTKDGTAGLHAETVKMIAVKRLLAPYETDSEDEATPEVIRKHLPIENVRDPSGGVENRAIDDDEMREDETDM